MLSKGDFVWLPTVKLSLKRLKEMGYLLLVVSNQRGVARGLMTENDLAQIDGHIQADLKKLGTKIDGFYFCTHNHEDNCGCRKPKTGLLKKAWADFGFDPELSFCVGDSVGDIEAGSKFGCQTVLVLSGQTKRRVEVKSWSYRPDFVCSNLMAVVDTIKRCQLLEKRG
ncbi:HAD-IIIA family hydrolase [Patescibacteria group bacterium]|nr:HAD-IIIA family hydrolase [Patescibacteria group bacterium]